MNRLKIIYLNCGERYECMVYHRSYTHNLSSREIEAWKKIQAWTAQSCVLQLLLLFTDAIFGKTPYFTNYFSDS